MARRSAHDGSCRSGALVGADLGLDRPPPGPPAGQRRPWEWLTAEPWTDRERRLADLPGHVETEQQLLERILAGS